METWQSAILYSFLGYILFHMIVDDIIHIIRAIYGNKPFRRDHYETTNERDIPLTPRGIATNRSHSPRRGAEVTPDVSTTIEDDSLVGIDLEIGQDKPDVVDNPRNTTHSIPQPSRGHQLHKDEHRSFVLIVYKICDVVLYCLTGYFHAFTTCWCACLNCLESLLSKYFNLLESMIKHLTAFPTVIYLSITAVLCLSIGCMMLYIVVG